MIKFWGSLRIVLSFVCTQFIFSIAVSGQSNISHKDSIKIKSQIEGFYNWYIDKARNQRINTDFNPSFERRFDGMTTLNFDNYKSTLRKYNFSEDFIQTKVNTFQKCLDNLSKIPFDEFIKYQDLDDFEQINCDFKNVYEWTGGMELNYKKVELTRLIQINRKKISGVIGFDSNDSALVTFRKSGGVWKIDNLTHQ